MHAIDGHVLPLMPSLRAQSRLRHQSHDRATGAANGTYADLVPASRDSRVRAFAAFVKRALAEAQDRGMDTEEIEERTGVPRSTIYRWTRAEVANPGRDRVHQFVDGLGIPRKVAAQILGWDGEPPSPDPDPAIDPDLRAVARRLADPTVTTEEKVSIRATLRYLAKGG